MSDEYSLHGRFLLGLDSAAEYERRLTRLRRIEAEREDTEMNTETRTPPQIVGAAEDPVQALTDFLAQELEHWQFAVQGLGADGVVKVIAGDCELYVAVAPVRAPGGAQ